MKKLMKNGDFDEKHLKNGGSEHVEAMKKSQRMDENGRDVIKRDMICLINKGKNIAKDGL